MSVVNCCQVTHEESYVVKVNKLKSNYGNVFRFEIIELPEIKGI